MKTPIELCEQYAEGALTRAELIAALTDYPYVPGNRTDGYDTLVVDPPGTWSELSLAHFRGLIDDDIYAEVFNARHPTEAGSHD